jgi:hypothetical protein
MRIDLSSKRSEQEFNKRLFVILSRVESNDWSKTSDSLVLNGRLFIIRVISQHGSRQCRCEWVPQLEVDYAVCYIGNSIIYDARHTRMSYTYEGDRTVTQEGNEVVGEYSWIYHWLSIDLRRKHSRQLFLEMLLQHFFSTVMSFLISYHMSFNLERQWSLDTAQWQFQSFSVKYTVWFNHHW